MGRKRQKKVFEIMAKNLYPSLNDELNKDSTILSASVEWKDGKINIGDKFGIEDIQVTTFHLSCQSDVDWDGYGWDKHDEFGGMIIYSTGSLEDEISKKVKIKPGYVIIRHITDVIQDTDEGIVHGALCRELTGFAVIKGQVQMNSSSCNMYGKNANYGNDDRGMNKVEKSLIERAVEVWKAGKVGKQNIPVIQLNDKNFKDYSAGGVMLAIHE